MLSDASTAPDLIGITHCLPDSIGTFGKVKMNWLIQALRSSIGKKMPMAITGLGFCLSLLAHSAGNLTIYQGVK
jgi:hypothetical protein